MSKAIFLTLSIMSLFEGTEEATVVNVAWDGMLQQCLFPIDNPELVDGDRFKLALAYKENCEKDFTVIFGAEHQVHYVVLYGGQSMDGIASFDVEFRVFSKRAVCGSYIRRRTNNFGGMRVNCLESYLTSRVFIDVKRVPFYLNEIEIYSFEDDGQIMIYRGCYKHFATEIKYPLRETHCKMYCILKWLTYIAFKESECFCSNDFDESQEPHEEDCDIVCSDTQRQSCGGKDAYSVFLVKIRLPSYKACLEGFNATNVTESDDMTIVKCLQLCDDNYYAALKDGRFCGCFDAEKKYPELADTNCSTPCVGDPNFYCGGVSEWSVFRTCKDCVMDTLPCSKLLRCSGDYDIYGVCTGGCQVDNFGDHCIERESISQSHLHMCSKDTCKSKPNSYCYYNRLVAKSTCYCYSGFKHSDDGKSCEDIDECLYEACDDKISTCENKLGSFKCKCKSGYPQITDIICGGQKRFVKTMSIMIVIAAILLVLLILAMMYILARKSK